MDKQLVGVHGEAIYKAKLDTSQYGERLVLIKSTKDIAGDIFGISFLLSKTDVEVLIKALHQSFPKETIEAFDKLPCTSWREKPSML